MVLGLKALKIAASKCVQVKWTKAESGACYVKYEIVLRNKSGNDLYSQTVYNIGEMMICNLPTYNNITSAHLTISFKATSKKETAFVSETPISTLASTATGMTFY